MNERDREPRLSDENRSSASQMLGAFIQDRDEEAFAQLVHLYGPLVYGVCRRVVRSHHDAEEAFQATFLTLAQKAASIQNRELLGGWLFRVAFQVSIRARSAANLRRKKERPMCETDEPVTSDPAVWLELEPILDWELNGLSEKYRLPVLLCDLEGCTQNEAATKLGWSLGTLSTRLTKARTILAGRLARRGLTLSAGTIAVLLSENAASAAMPPSLFASTTQITMAMTSGQAASASVASSKVVALAQGAAKPILFTNLKVAAVALVLVATAALGLQTQPEKEKPPVVASRDAELMAIARSHRSQEEALKSLYVAYHQKDDSDGVPRASNLGKFLTEAVSFQDAIFAFKGNMRYHKAFRPQDVADFLTTIPDDDPEKAPFSTTGSISTFNGKASYLLDTDPHERQPSPVSISLPEHQKIGQNGRFSQTYLNCSFRSLPDPFQIDNDHETKSLAHLFDHYSVQKRPEREIENGASCVVIEWNEVRRTDRNAEGQVQEQPMKHVVWCDPEIGYAVRRSESTFVNFNHILASRTLVSDFTEVVPGVWLPKSCSLVCYPAEPERRDSFVFRFQLTVFDIHANDVDDAFFTPSIPPGSLVFDSSQGPQKLSYIMPATQHEFEETIRALKERKASMPPVQTNSVPPLKTNSWKRHGTLAFVLLNGVLAVVLVIVAWRHRTRSARQM